MTKTFKAILSTCLLMAATLGAQSSAPAPIPAQVSAADLDAEVKQFLSREITAHVQDIHSLDPPQERVVGALTTGDFSWGTFMRALAASSDYVGARTIAGRDVPTFVGKIGLIESRQGGKTFAQLYGALALQQYGTDLNNNALWQSLSAEEKQAWRSLLDPSRFYDRKTRHVINLPENYFGVASRVATMSYRLGIITDRAYVDDILDQAARQFTGGALYSDDAIPTGRYDRYSNEYARYVYEAAETAGRNDIMKALEPSLKTQMRLWWDLISADGYGYPWGRSLGAISYMDTLEIVAFDAQHPQFRPAPLAQLASAYYAAWRWLRADFQDDRHLLSVFAFGRGDYSYINKEREWQQTTAFLGKLAGAQAAFIPALRKEQVATFSKQLELRDVQRFEFFRRDADRLAGVWLVRHGQMHFALPFTTGPKAGASDYQAAPHGLPGFAVPVEQTYPCLVLFIELAGGKVIAASDGADEIRPAADAASVTAVWKRWVTPGGRAAAFVDPGITSTVTWRLDGDHLRRIETLVASKDIQVRRIWIAFPSTADRVQTAFQAARSDRFISREGGIEFRLTHSDFSVAAEIKATGDSVLGKGSRGPIPLHLVLESRDLTLKAGKPMGWEIDLHTIAP
jgi:hypothetical protein